jgi:hypothetical protein
MSPNNSFQEETMKLNQVQLYEFTEKFYRERLLIGGSGRTERTRTIAFRPIKPGKMLDKKRGRIEKSTFIPTFLFFLVKSPSVLDRKPRNLACQKYSQSTEDPDIPVPCFRPSTARHKMLFEERLGGEERRLMHLVPAPECWNRLTTARS